MVKKFLLICITTFISLAAVAKELTLSVDAPRVIALGAPFRIEFTLNGKPDSFSAPDFEGFDVVAGPSTSQSTSISVINGKMERVSSYVYTYVLVARSEGNLEIGAATAEDGKRILKTEPLRIEVVRENGNTAAQDGSDRTAPRQTIAEDDIVLLLTTNKESVYEGEPILAQIKVLTRAELVDIAGAKYPSFEGFWTQDLEIDTDGGWEREVYNDKIYDSKVLREYLLFPQKKGTVTIEPMSMDFVARVLLPAQQNTGGSLFDAFFSGPQYQTVRRRVVSPKTTIEVKPFEQPAPASYKGAVGSFSIRGELSDDMISANNSGTLKITVQGSGNLPLVNEPAVSFPKSFEPYKVKTSENIRASQSGVSGSKTFEYPFIARAAGTYTIEPVVFSYFDTNKGGFVTLRTQPQRIAVTADTTRNGSNTGTTIITGMTRDELKILGDDIRFIKTGDPHLKRTATFLIASPWYIGGLAGLFLLFLLFVAYFRKRIKASRDIARQRNKKASKAALARLKEARRSMHANDTAQFYQNTVKAMWGYVGDKLNLPNAALTKENISERLRGKGIAEEVIAEFREILSECEYAQYAPSGSTNMNTVYDKAIRVISSLENKL